MSNIRGRGAWSTLGKDNQSRNYCWIEDRPLDGSQPDLGLHYLAVNYAVKAIQGRLNDLGFQTRSGSKLAVDGVFGRKTRRAVMWFQGIKGIEATGAVGPTTSGALWVDKVRRKGEDLGGGRPDLLWGLIALESALDPGAVSYSYAEENGPDYGLCQINLRFNPEVSIAQAFDPSFAIKWSALRVAENLERFTGKGEALQVNCALAYHNSPVRAAEWWRDGVAPTEQIATYVRLVLQRAAGFPREA